MTCQLICEWLQPGFSLLFTFGSRGRASTAHCTGSLTGMHRCVWTEVRKRESLWAIYIVDCVVRWARCFWLAAGKDRVSQCQAADLSVFMYLHWDTHTQSHIWGHMHTHIHTHWQHNSCSADMMVATRSHPCNPSTQRENGGHCVCVCVNIPLSFNVWFQPAMKTVIWAHLCLAEFPPATCLKCTSPTWPPSSSKLPEHLLPFPLLPVLKNHIVIDT